MDSDRSMGVYILHIELVKFQTFSVESTLPGKGEKESGSAANIEQSRVWLLHELLELIKARFKLRLLVALNVRQKEFLEEELTEVLVVVNISNCLLRQLWIHVDETATIASDICESVFGDPMSGGGGSTERARNGLDQMASNKSCCGIDEA
jgi:hypothetical protein